MISKGSEGSHPRPVFAGMDATRLSEILIDLLDEHVDDLDDGGLPANELMGAEVETFTDANVLTDDVGFVVSLADGSQLQIIVIQSRK